MLLIGHFSLAQWNQLGNAILGENSLSSLGRAVAINNAGSIIAVGSPTKGYTDHTGSGQVQVFQLINQIWTPLGNSIEAIDGDGLFGEAVSLNGAGNIVAIGSPFNDIAGEAAGAVRVYELINDQWVLKGAQIFAGYNLSNSGSSVSLSDDGNTLAIGNPHGFFSVTVKVFNYINGNWINMGNAIASQAVGDVLGKSVALSADGSVLAIGAAGFSGNGHLEIYQFENGVWTQIGNNIDGEVGNDWVGFSVSISADGTIVAFGAPRNDGAGQEAGHARVYELTNGSWIQLGSDLDGTAADDLFGHSVSLSHDGKTIAVGGPINTANSSGAGQTKIFKYQNEEWVQIGANIIGDLAAASGYSVALCADGETVVIGSPEHAGNGNLSGQAKVYTVKDIVGLAQPELEFSIYPNPVSHELYLNTNTQSITRLEIIDLSGKLILQQEGAIERINVQGLAKGLYTLRLYTDQGPINQQFIKQ